MSSPERRRGLWQFRRSTARAGEILPDAGSLNQRTAKQTDP
jgi:hypothetical protein